MVFEQLKDQLATLGVEVVSPDKDGNCFFAAVAAALELHDQHCHHTLRLAAVDELERLRISSSPCWEAFEMLCVTEMDASGASTLEGWLKRLRVPAQGASDHERWASIPTQSALANRLCCQIRVLNVCNDVKATVLNTNESRARSAIYLILHANHWYCAQPSDVWMDLAVWHEVMRDLNDSTRNQFEIAPLQWTDTGNYKRRPEAELRELIGMTHTLSRRREQESTAKATEPGMLISHELLISPERIRHSRETAGFSVDISLCCQPGQDDPSLIWLAEVTTEIQWSLNLVDISAATHCFKQDGRVIRLDVHPHDEWDLDSLQESAGLLEWQSEALAREKAALEGWLKTKDPDSSHRLYIFPDSFDNQLITPRPANGLMAVLLWNEDQLDSHLVQEQLVKGYAPPTQPATVASLDSMVDLPFLATPLAGNPRTYVVGQEAAVLRANVDSSCAREGDTSTQPDVEIVNVNLTQTKLHSYADSLGSEGLVLSPRSPPPVSLLPVDAGSETTPRAWSSPPLISYGEP